MGLFKKRYANGDNSFATKEPPINGGNEFTTQKVLKAQVDIDKNSIPIKSTEVNNKWKTEMDERTYTMWWMLNFQADYFVSLLPVKCKETYLTRMLYALFRIHFLFGNCGIYKSKTGEFVPVYEVKTSIDWTGKPKELEVNVIWDIIAGQDINLYNENKKPKYPTLKLDKKDIEENYVRLTVKSSGFGAIVTWTPFIKQQVSLLKKIYMYSFLFTKKMIYNASDTSTSRKELDIFFNDDLPFLVNLDPLDAVSKRFTNEGIDNSGAGVEDMINYYNFVIDTYYSLLGRRANVDVKRERNVVNEVEASQDNFDILENEDRCLKLNFLEELKTKFGIEWELEEKESKEGEDNDLQGISNKDKDTRMGNPKN